jgi:RHS repeat-associated protein
VYDGNGNVTQRIWVSSSGFTNRVQNLVYDAFDRLISVTDRDAQNNGVNWEAIYDGLGRRGETDSTLVVSNTPIYGYTAGTTVDSTYDPQAEFEEIGAAVNSDYYIEAYGPDASGGYGDLNGVGGLDTVNLYGHTTTMGVVQDVFGNVLASISNSVVYWNPTRLSSYGPVPGYEPPALSPTVSLTQALAWRGKRVDETGLVYLGARHYDPLAGRFTTADPLGHAASMDLYSFSGGDPVNFFDPSGRFGKQISDQYQGLVDNYNNYQQQAYLESTYAPSDFHYTQEYDPTLTAYSGLVDMIPVVGGIKQWYELNTGKDAFSGAWLQGNDYLQALGVVGNFAPVAFGPAALLEGGGETEFLGAGERGLIEVGTEEEAVAAENVGAMNAAEGENAAFQASENAVDTGPAPATSGTQLSPNVGGASQPQGYKYDAMNPGPLPDKIASTFAGGRYNEGVFQPGQTVFKAGDAANPGGSYFNFTPPTGIAQSRIDNAVKPQWIDPETGALKGESVINSAISAEFPAGSKYYYGPVSSQGDVYIGGPDQIQIFVPDARATGSFKVLGPLR